MSAIVGPWTPSSVEIVMEEEDAMLCWSGWLHVILIKSTLANLDIELVPEVREGSGSWYFYASKGNHTLQSSVRQL